MLSYDNITVIAFQLVVLQNVTQINGNNFTKTSKFKLLVVSFDITVSHDVVSLATGLEVIIR